MLSLISYVVSYAHILQDTGLGDGRRTLLVLDSATASAASLDGLNHAVGLLVAVRDLAEDDMAAVEPRGDDGRDEELGTIAVRVMLAYFNIDERKANGIGIRVRASVGHGEKERLVVGKLEVLIGKLLAVDALATGALCDGQ
jgi:hypothetical protein